MDAGQRALHGADDIRHRDVTGGAGQQVATLRPALAPHDPSPLELVQDVQQEFERDLLRVGDLLALDGAAPLGRGQLRRGSDRIVCLRRDPHPVIVPGGESGSERPEPYPSRRRLRPHTMAPPAAALAPAATAASRSTGLARWPFGPRSAYVVSG